MYMQGQLSATTSPDLSSLEEVGKDNGLDSRIKAIFMFSNVL